MLTPRMIRDYADRVARRFDPQAVVLFGSRAGGKPRRDSDVDLLVIMPFDGHPLDAAVRVCTEVRPSFAVDVIVEKPDDVARRYREFDPLIREALDRGKVLYERDAGSVARQSGGRLPSRRNAHAGAKASQPRRRLLSRAAMR